MERSNYYMKEIALVIKLKLADEADINAIEMDMKEFLGDHSKVIDYEVDTL